MGSHEKMQTYACEDCGNGFEGPYLDADGLCAQCRIQECDHRREATKQTPQGRDYCGGCGTILDGGSINVA